MTNNIISMQHSARLAVALVALSSTAAEAAEPRGPGNALFCAAGGGAGCWTTGNGGGASSAGPWLVLEESAAAAAFKAGSPANHVSLVPSLAPIWSKRPRAAALPGGTIWDVACNALLGCYDTRFDDPLPDVARGDPVGLSVLMWVQGHAIHGGDIYVTLLANKTSGAGVHASVDKAGTGMELSFVALLADGAVNISLSTTGCGPASLFDDKPHQVALLLDGGARMASLLVDDSLCTNADAGWAAWPEDASVGDIRMFYAAYNERGLSRLRVYARPLLTSEVLGSFYAGLPAAVVELEGERATTAAIS